MKFGWKPQKPDGRDFALSITVPRVMPIRSSVEKFFSTVEDQGDLGSCVFNAGVALLESLMIRNKHSFFDMSRLFPYYNVRVDYGQVNEDTGAEIRDAVSSLRKLGCCTELLWPYVTGKFAIKPPAKCYQQALNYQITRYEVVNGLNEIKACISSSRVGVIFGFWVYESFMNIGADGIMPVPKSYEDCLGGHAVVIVAYDDKAKRVKVRNSWGKNWGDKGYFYMPYEFLLDPDECMDFWRITAAEQM
jgi:C1A family cysteine protease